MWKNTGIVPPIHQAARLNYNLATGAPMPTYRAIDESNQSRPVTRRFTTLAARNEWIAARAGRRGVTDGEAALIREKSRRNIWKYADGICGAGADFA